MDDFTWVEEFNGQLFTPMSTAKRKVRPKKFEYVGWGSRQLISFLESIGKDTGSKISQYDVTDVINKYVVENKLMHPVKKKRIACDERLLCLFGRKTISRIKIYDLLEAHYAENRDDSDFDFLYSSDDEQQKSLPPEKKYNQKKKVLQTPKSCFAAIISDNIKLVYLKRSLVQELIKEPDIFEGKMLGSFVRIKSDPNDYLQKNSHLLVQVTGVKKADGTDDFLLQVTNCIKDVRISMLSDDNFSQEECEDLHQRIKDGLLKRPTVVEMEEKARTLHRDVTKHWLPRELVSLQRLIDRANEKGWRRELFDYLEKRELLQSAEEQSRLLCEVPEVVAEELKAPSKEIVDDKEQWENASEIPNLSNDKKQKENNSFTSNLQTALEISTCDIATNGRLPAWISFGKDSADDKIGPIFYEDRKHVEAIVRESKDVKADVNGEKQAEVIQVPLALLNGEKKTEVSHVPVSRTVIDLNKGFNITSNLQVIELSDDEEIDHQKDNNQAQDHYVGDIATLMWHYKDPRGHIQGPFSLSSLKGWSDADYFPPDFKVWKAGQSQEQAVLLNDILFRIFPC